MKVIQHMRDEAHRFGITHHRNRRSKGTMKSELTSIKGVGEETMARLLTHFKSVKKIKEASVEDIAAVIGKAKAQLIHSHFNA